jgi:NADP-dependent 3-hydroxy acid dehydrogenase YdfG
VTVSLKDKIVFVTGASSGIGEACVKAFAAEGARLILIARRIERIKKLADTLQSQHKIKSYVAQLDLRNYEQVKLTIASLPEEWQAIDILVNNAGLALGIEKIQDGVLENWETMIDTNVKGLLYVTKEILPGMLRRNNGHIFNIASIAGIQVYPGGNVYCASKSAVLALTEGMLVDLVHTPIRVTAISPGMVETEFSFVRFKGDTERASKVYKGIQALTGEDVANAVIFCATRPPHVTISELVIIPTNQANAYVTYKNPS